MLECTHGSCNRRGLLQGCLWAAGCGQQEAAGSGGPRLVGRTWFEFSLTSSLSRAFISESISCFSKLVDLT